MSDPTETGASGAHEPLAEPSPEPPAEPSAPAQPKASGWSFWRPKLARALLVGGVLYAATRFAPALPHTQSFDFRAPEGEQIIELELTLRDENGAPQIATVLHPPSGQSQLRHQTELPDGTYALELSAVLVPRGASPDAPGHHTVELSRDVRLEEHTIRIDLTP